MMTTKMMETLKSAGIANEWHKGDMHRLYIDLAKADDLYYDNSENFQHGRLALNRYERNSGKVWIDLPTGEISTKSIGDAEEVISQIMELVAFLTPADEAAQESSEEAAEDASDETARKLWYAVMSDREDNDWGTGSFDLDEAMEMLKEYPEGYIAVIDANYDENGNATTDGECIDEIYG